MKFKKNAVATQLILGALLSNSALAGLTSVRKPTDAATSSNKSSSGPSNVKVTQAQKVDDQKLDLKEGVSSKACNRDMNSAEYFPLDIFRHLTLNGDSIKFEIRPDNKIMVKVPPIYDACGKFKPVLNQDKETKNVTIMMTLENNMKYGEFVECLNGKKPVKEGEVKPADVLTDGAVDHTKISGKDYSEYSYVFDYEFDKKADIKKTVKLSYGFPVAYDNKEGYENPYGVDSKVELPSSACMVAEKIAPELVYLNKGQDVLIEELNTICMSKDAQRIAEARKAIGNADALTDIAEKIKKELDAAYLSAVKTRVTEIAAEMGKIEDKINKNKDTMDEATAKKEIAKYAELAKELDSKFLNPAIYRLDTLMQDRDKTEDTAVHKAIDDEIKKINEEVSAFSKRQPTSFANIYSLMEKHAITDQAKTIEDIRLKSYLYGKVYAGPVDEKRGKPLTFEAANQQQVDRLQKFDRTLTDWTDQYLVGQGNLYPIKKTEKERQAVIDRMNTRWAAYEKKEYSDYYNYCGTGMTGGVKNPIKCKDFMNGVNQRRNNELKRRDKDLYYIKGRNAKLEKMGMNWNEYQRKIASREAQETDLYEPYGSSYTSYEDNFTDRFPQYGGPSTTTAYDPSMYNMGYQNPMMMQMPQMQSPYMYGAQMPIQQGQFQMPQMMPQQQMGGAWPGI